MNGWNELTVIFMLILMVSPSLNPKSSSGCGHAFSSSIFSWFFTHLKWSCRETFKSNESDRSPKPRPKNAVRPVKQKKNTHNFYFFFFCSLFTHREIAIICAWNVVFFLVCHFSCVKMMCQWTEQLKIFWQTLTFALITHTHHTKMELQLKWLVLCCFVFFLNCNSYHCHRRHESQNIGSCHWLLQ